MIPWQHSIASCDYSAMSALPQRHKRPLSSPCALPACEECVMAAEREPWQPLMVRSPSHGPGMPPVWTQSGGELRRRLLLLLCPMWGSLSSSSTTARERSHRRSKICKPPSLLQQPLALLR